MHKNRNLVICTGLLLAATTSALADFAGQPILGPLVNGAVFFNDTTGKADDNDGFDSGIHIFDIWDGGDDVYRLIWGGGDLTVTLDSFGGSDNDLFVYSPGMLDSTGDYTPRGSHDVVTIFGAAAGDYYINVDCASGFEGAYSVGVTPEPGSLALLGVGGFMLIARKRRQA